MKLFLILSLIFSCNYDCMSQPSVGEVKPIIFINDGDLILSDFDTIYEPIFGFNNLGISNPKWHPNGDIISFVNEYGIVVYKLKTKWMSKAINGSNQKWGDSAFYGGISLFYEEENGYFEITNDYHKLTDGIEAKIKPSYYFSTVIDSLLYLTLNHNDKLMLWDFKKSIHKDILIDTKSYTWSKVNEVIYGIQTTDPRWFHLVEISKYNKKTIHSFNLDLDQELSTIPSEYKIISCNLSPLQDQIVFDITWYPKEIKELENINSEKKLQPSLSHIFVCNIPTNQCFWTDEISNVIDIKWLDNNRLVINRIEPIKTSENTLHYLLPNDFNIEYFNQNEIEKLHLSNDELIIYDIRIKSFTKKFSGHSMDIYHSIRKH